MSTATKRRVISPKGITTKNVMNEAQNVGWTLAGLYAAALINKPVSEFIDKISPKSDNPDAAVSGFQSVIADYAAPVTMLAAGLLIPMVVNFGSNKKIAQPLMNGMAIYGGSAVLKNAMGKNLLAGQLGTVTTNYRELNAARVDALPGVEEPVYTSV